jgi:deoxycytidylate deaminase
MSDDIYYLRKARELTACSDDPSTKVGVVITCPDTKRLIFGVNHIPVPRIMETMPRDEKLELIVHAEMGAICTAARYGDKLNGSTMYMVARSAMTGAYWGSAPCLECAKHVIAAGIKRVVTVGGLPVTDRWFTSVSKGWNLLQEAGILYTEVDYAELTD